VHLRDFLPKFVSVTLALQLGGEASGGEKSPRE